MKILNADIIRKADQFTIANEPISSIELMERASIAFVDWFELNYDKARKVFIFCGTGNNGGDGLAIARILISKNWDVNTFVINRSAKRSDDFLINYKKLSELTTISDIEKNDDLNFAVDKKDIAIDAIFGSGLTREVRGIYAETIDYIHSSLATIISVDTPSGLFIDIPSSKKSIIKADHVLSFQLPKLAFLLPENEPYVKNWSMVDIGLDIDFIRNQNTNFEYIDLPLIKDMYISRSKFSHKTNFGRLLLVAGSWGKMGAAVLCAKSCVKSGGGLVTAYIPKCGYAIMQTSIPEVMVSVDTSEHFVSEVPELATFDAIGVGPGLSNQVLTHGFMKSILKVYKKTMVLDADALNIIADDIELLSMLPQDSVLTPHPGEFKRLVGKWKDDFERLDLQIDMSKKYGVIVVLKGAHTSISTPSGRVYFNSTGNPGMATGGSGDVLTGIITALLGQKYSPENAAILGVYLHGLAADIAVKFLGEESLSASDIIDYLPQAFMEIKGSDRNYNFAKMEYL